MRCSGISRITVADCSIVMIMTGARRRPVTFTNDVMTHHFLSGGCDVCLQLLAEAGLSSRELTVGRRRQKPRAEQIQKLIQKETSSRPAVHHGNLRFELKVIFMCGCVNVEVGRAVTSDENCSHHISFLFRLCSKVLPSWISLKKQQFAGW